MTDNNDHLLETGGRVSCPYCNRESFTEHRVNRCRCGRWFEVFRQSDRDGVPVFEGSTELKTRRVDGPDEVFDE